MSDVISTCNIFFFFFLEVVQKYIGDFESAEKKGKKRLTNLPLSCGHARVLTPLLALHGGVTPTYSSLCSLHSAQPCTAVQSQNNPPGYPRGEMEGHE